MSIKTKLLLITILPVFLIAIGMMVFISVQSERLSNAQVATVENMILSSKKQELENYVSLARTAIDPFYTSAWASTPLAQKQVSEIMNRMTFGQDGYFYVYKADGTNIVHPRLPELVGKNWINLQDTNGQPVIQDLINGARRGGEFYSYVWNKPSTGSDADKIGYSVYLDNWNWMMGSGLYVDDIAAQVAAVGAPLAEGIEQTKWVLLALTLSAVLFSTVFVASVRLSEQRMADARLKELTARLVDVQENERKRVSTELHDGISQLLVSVRYSLEQAQDKGADNPAVLNPVNRSMDILETAIGEVRRISMGLRPSILDDMGLAAALKSLAHDFEEQSGINTEIETVSVGALLESPAKTALYRVAQEALTNVAKHSSASHVEISLSTRKNRVIMTITDNGVGLGNAHHRKNPVNSGLGIRNIEERMDALGGTCTLLGRSSGGLTIIVSLPATKKAVKDATDHRAIAAE